MIYILGNAKAKGYILVNFPTNTISCVCKNETKLLECPETKLGGGYIALSALLWETG